MATTQFFTLSQTTAGDIWQGNAGDVAYVAPGVVLADTDASGTTSTLHESSYGTAEILGAVSGYIPVFFSGAVGQTSNILIGVGGSATDVPLPGASTAILIQGGNYNISNSGFVAAFANSSDNGIELDTAIAVPGSGLVDNAGTISAGGIGVDGLSSAAADTMVLDNTGTISGGVAAISVLSSIAEVANSGTLIGAVTLGLGSSLTDSGRIDGDVTLAGASAGATDVTFASTGVLTAKPGGTALTISLGAYAIVNGGAITAMQNGAGTAFGDGVDVHGAGKLVNHGKIAGANAGVFNDDNTSGDTAVLVNYGSILGGASGAVLDIGAHKVVLYNYGSLAADANADAVATSAATVETLLNAGTIAGDVALNAAGSSIVNTGAIGPSGANPAVAFGAGSARFVNRGAVVGDVTFNGTGNVFNGVGGSVTGTIHGAGADGVYYAGADGESFDFTASGAKFVKGGAGDDTFNFGAHLTAATRVDGGGGANTVALAGVYALAFGAQTMVNVQRLQAAAGFNYTLTTNDANVAAGQILTVDASALGAANRLVFNGSAETDGHFDLIGGAGADTFALTAAHLSSLDAIAGGGGAAIDRLVFTSAGTISASALANVSAIEAIFLANGTNSLTLTNALVGSANGAALAVVGGTGADTIDARGVTTASDKVTMSGGAGADQLFAGGGSETFVYATSLQSAGPGYDTITGANFGAALAPIDRFDIPGAAGTIQAINPTQSGALSTLTFNSDLAAALAGGKLGANDAVLFKATSGTLSGDTFLVVDFNHSAGYQANQDLVVRLVGATGTLQTGSFI